MEFDNEIKELLQNENSKHTASINFTDKVMEQIDVVVNEKKVIKPLIGKSTFIMIAIFILTLITLTIINAKNQPLTFNIYTFINYFNSLINILNNYWVYIFMGVIIGWEFIIRRRFNLI